MSQIVRNLTLADADGCCVLICDRDAKWRRAVRARLQNAGIRVVQTPSRAPNAKAVERDIVDAIPGHEPHLLHPRPDHRRHEHNRGRRKAR
jgi:hypothetical protein